MIRPCLVALMFSCLITSPHTFAQDPGISLYAGDWSLTLKHDFGRGDQTGDLRIQASETGLIAHVEGGPVSIKIDKGQIELVVDDLSGAGTPFERTLLGSLDNGILEGRFGPEQITEICRLYPASCVEPSGSWRAERKKESSSTGKDIGPNDLIGGWRKTGGFAAGGISRYSMDLTPAAEEWVAGFNPMFDLPMQRCASDGLVKRYDSAGIISFEILDGNERLTFLYTGNVARPIFFDGRRPHKFAENTPFGFSTGNWEDDTLVIETTMLSRSVRGYRGEPISEKARVVERFTLDGDGILHGVLTLYDPENYNTPPVRRHAWRRDNKVVVAGADVCDPDSFYRQLYENNKMQEYIDRADRRL